MHVCLISLLRCHTCAVDGVALESHLPASMSVWLLHIQRARVCIDVLHIHAHHLYVWFLFVSRFVCLALVLLLFVCCSCELMCKRTHAGSCACVCVCLRARAAVKLYSMFLVVYMCAFIRVGKLHVCFLACVLICIRWLSDCPCTRARICYFECARFRNQLQHTVCWRRSTG